MSIEMAGKKSQKTPSYDDLLQPVVYGVLPDQLNDEISFVDLFSKLASQRKLIFTVTMVGALLATALALVLPTVYQPSLRVSMPSAGNVAVLATVNTILGGEDNIPSSQQAVFSSYYHRLRSRDVLADYIRKSNYLEKLYPGSAEDKAVLLAGLVKGLRVNIEEPSPERKGAYIANPERVSVSIEIGDEAVGVELLNNFAGYANQRLVADLQDDASSVIRNKIEVLTSQVAKLREQYQQDRMLTIKKMEQENAREIALLQEQVSAYLAKAKANRVTRVANAMEALEMAKSLDIVYPTTLDAVAQKGQKSRNVNTAITVVDKQVSSLYLKGEKYLSTLIETLTKRKSDEKFLAEINNLREKIHIIKNDRTLAALKKRQSDDPWIRELPEKLAEVAALKALNSDFTAVLAYSLNDSASVANEKIKPKRKVIVAVGFVLSLFIALFVALIVASLKERDVKAKMPSD